jgi:hypothetical protein
MFSAFYGHKFRKFSGNPSPLFVPGAGRLLTFQKTGSNRRGELISTTSSHLRRPGFKSRRRTKWIVVLAIVCK